MTSTFNKMSKQNTLIQIKPKRLFCKSKKKNSFGIPSQNDCKYFLLDSNQNFLRSIEQSEYKSSMFENSINKDFQNKLSFLRNEYIVSTLSSTFKKICKIFSEKFPKVHIGNKKLKEKKKSEKNDLDKKNTSNTKQKLNKSWFVISAKRRKLLMSSVKCNKGEKKDELPKVVDLNLDKNLLIFSNFNSIKHEKYTNFMNKSHSTSKCNNFVNKIKDNKTYNKILFLGTKNHNSNSSKAILRKWNFPSIKSLKNCNSKNNLKSHIVTFDESIN